MIRVSERFEVSGSYLARVCTVLNVPRPERGYWAKLAVGKAPTKPPLPDPRPGDQLSWSKDGELASLPKPAAPTFRRRSAARVQIPKDRAHELLHGAKRHFENGRPIDEGEHLKPYKKLLLDVTASQACLDKALQFANELFNALESAGRRVVIAPADSSFRRCVIDEREVPSPPRDRYHYSRLWSPQRPTVAFLDTMAFGLAIVEMSELVTLRYVNGQYIRESDYTPPKRDHYGRATWTTDRQVPSGRLKLIVYSPYALVDWSLEWPEVKSTSLNASIPKIVKSLESQAPKLVVMLEDARRQAEIESQKREAEYQRYLREEDRRKVEKSIKESREHLGDVIDQWSRVIDVEQFLQGVERRAAELPEAEKRVAFERLALAREFVGTQDPLDFFLSWKIPRERYQPKFQDTDEINGADAQ